MRQIWTGNNQDQLNPSATEFNTVMGNVGWNASGDTLRPQICPADGFISELYVEFDRAPANSGSYTITLIVAGLDTNVEVTITDPAVAGSNLIDSVAVSAGDLVYLRSVPNDSPSAAPFMIWSMAFDGDNAKESVLMGISATALSTSATEFSSLVQSDGAGPSTTEVDHQQLVAGTGTIQALYVWLEADPGTDPDAYRVTVRKNGSSTTLTVTVTADATTGSDLINSFTVAPEDLINVTIEPLNTPAVAVRAAWSVVFVSDTDGESLMFGGSSTDLDNEVSLNKAWMGVTSTSWNSEANESTLANTMDMKDLYVLIGAAPGSGNTWDFTTQTPAAGNLTLQIADPATSGSDLVNVDNIVPGDHISLQYVPTSLPTTTWGKFGAIQFIQPRVTGSVTTSNLIRRAMSSLGYI